MCFLPATRSSAANYQRLRTALMVRVVCAVLRRPLSIFLRVLALALSIGLLLAKKEESQWRKPMMTAQNEPTDRRPTDRAKAMPGDPGKPGIHLYNALVNT
jgi:hypothetical protein